MHNLRPFLGSIHGYIPNCRQISLQRDSQICSTPFIVGLCRVNTQKSTSKDWLASVLMCNSYKYIFEKIYKISCVCFTSIHSLTLFLTKHNWVNWILCHLSKLQAIFGESLHFQLNSVEACILDNAFNIDCALVAIFYFIFC